MSGLDLNDSVSPPAHSDSTVPLRREDENVSDAGPLSVDMLSPLPEPVSVPQDPAEAMRRTLASLEGSVAQAVGGDGQHLFFRDGEESLHGSTTNELWNGRGRIRRCCVQRESVRSLQEKHAEIKTRMLTAEKALLSIRLDISNTEARRIGYSSRQLQQSLAWRAISWMKQKRMRRTKITRNLPLQVVPQNLLR